MQCPTYQKPSCAASTRSLLVRVVRNDGRSKTFWRGIQDFGGPAAQGPSFAEKERTATRAMQTPPPCERQPNPRALGMRAVIASIRSSRQHLRQIGGPATRGGLQRSTAASGRYAFSHPLRRPLSHTQCRRIHARFKEPTIYALSTASGKAAIAVVRISGPACRQVRHA